MRFASFSSAALVCSLCAFGAIGCSGASDAVDTVTEKKTAELHGRWRDEAGVDRPASLLLVQDGLSAKLTLLLEGHSCLAESVIDVKVTLGGVKTDADVAGMRLSVDGEPGLEDIVGNFRELEEGPCERGWFNVNR